MRRRLPDPLVTDRGIVAADAKPFVEGLPSPGAARTAPMGWLGHHRIEIQAEPP